MKYLIVLALLIGGCSNTEDRKTPCAMYEERKIPIREYFRYPAEGYIERIEYRLVCVK